MAPWRPAEKHETETDMRLLLWETTRVLRAIICVVAVCPLALAGEPEPSFDNSQWIWTWPDPGSNSTRDMAMGCAYFRVDLALPNGATVAQADVFLAADNLCALYVNGKYVGEGDANPDHWNLAKRFDVAGVLAPGRNVVAVEAANTAPGPAGLVVYARIQLTDGRQVVLTSGDRWKCSDKKSRNWEQIAFDDSKWQRAYLVAPYGSDPWGKFAAGLGELKAGKPSLGEAPSLETRLVAASLSLPQQPVREVAPPEDYRWQIGRAHV